MYQLGVGCCCGGNCLTCGVPVKVVGCGFTRLGVGSVDPSSQVFFPGLLVKAKAYIVSGATVVTAGADYGEVPDVHTSNGSAFTARINSDGTLAGLDLTEPGLAVMPFLGIGGTESPSAPTVTATLSGGHGQGASCQVTTSGGRITAVTPVTQGRGYKIAPHVSLYAFRGSGGIVQAVLTGDKVTSYTIVNSGSGYLGIVSASVVAQGTDASVSITLSAWESSGNTTDSAGLATIPLPRAGHYYLVATGGSLNCGDGYTDITLSPCPLDSGMVDYSQCDPSTPIPTTDIPMPGMTVNFHVSRCGENCLGWGEIEYDPYIPHPGLLNTFRATFSGTGEVFSVTMFPIFIERPSGVCYSVCLPYQGSWTFSMPDQDGRQGYLASPITQTITCGTNTVSMVLTPDRALFFISLGGCFNNNTLFGGRPGIGAGASVSVTDDFGGSVSGTTDSNGMFVFEANIGCHYTWTASKPPRYQSISGEFWTLISFPTDTSDPSFYEGAWGAAGANLPISPGYRCLGCNDCTEPIKDTLYISDPNGTWAMHYTNYDPMHPIVGDHCNQPFDPRNGTWACCYNSPTFVLGSTATVVCQTPLVLVPVAVEYHFGGCNSIPALGPIGGPVLVEIFPTCFGNSIPESGEQPVISQCDGCGHATATHDDGSPYPGYAHGSVAGSASVGNNCSPGVFIWHFDIGLPGIFPPVNGVRVTVSE